MCKCFRAVGGITLITAMVASMSCASRSILPANGFLLRLVTPHLHLMDPHQVDSLYAEWINFDRPEKTAGSWIFRGHGREGTRVSKFRIEFLPLAKGSAREWALYYLETTMVSAQDELVPQISRALNLKAGKDGQGVNQSFNWHLPNRFTFSAQFSDDTCTVSIQSFGEFF